MKFKYVKRVDWLGLIGVTTYTDEEYDLDISLVEPVEEYGVFLGRVIIHSNLIETKKHMVQGKLVISNVLTSMLVLDIDTVDEKEIKHLEYILDEYQEDGELTLIEYKRNFTSLRYQFIHKNKNGEIEDDIIIDSIGKCEIHKLKWEEDSNWLMKLLNLF